VKARSSLSDLGQVSEYLRAEIPKAARSCGVARVGIRISCNNGRRLLGARCKTQER